MGCIIGIICCVADEIRESRESSNAPPQHDTAVPTSEPPPHQPSPYCGCEECVVMFQEYHIQQQRAMQRENNATIGSVAGSVAGAVVSEFIPFGGLLGELVSMGAEKATEKVTEKGVETALNMADERKYAKDQDDEKDQV